jgi:hypothetical protein
MTKTGTEFPPLIAREDAPGPAMVSDLLPLLSIVSGVVSVIVAGVVTLKLIVSPEFAVSIAFAVAGICNRDGAAQNG